MELVTENKAVQREVAALHDLCEAEGAYFHEHLRMVVANDGAMWLESTLTADQRDVLVSLPDSCLPRVDPVTFKLVGDDIEIEAIEDGALSDTQERCLKHMLAIYNATGKIAQHRETSPWIALDHAPALRDLLASGRRGAPKLMENQDRVNREGVSDDFVIRTFIGTRQYGALGDSVLMPFIDYANHHPRAAGFQGRPDWSPVTHRVSLFNSQPNSGTGEVLVAYTMLDALDAYMSYGFVDTAARSVRSVPVELENGAIDAESRLSPGPKKGKVQKDLTDIQPYTPMVLQQDESRIRLSHLMLPDSRAPFALRRVLNWAIRQTAGQLGLRHMRERVVDAEQAILDANRDFYTELERQLAATSETVPSMQRDMLDKLIAHQRAQIDAYVEQVQPQEQAEPEPA
jgi:hypothetical protein